MEVAKEGVGEQKGEAQRPEEETRADRETTRGTRKQRAGMSPEGRDGEEGCDEAGKEREEADRRGTHLPVRV